MPKVEPLKHPDGWLIPIPVKDYFVEVPNEEDPGADHVRVNVRATKIDGHFDGIWIHDAGGGQHSFKLCGEAGYLDAVAEALQNIAQKLRERRPGR
jgi:hypothetical protein